MDQTIKKELVSGGLWIISGKIFTIFSQLAVNAFLARLFSSDDMGLYFLITSLVQFFMMFSLLGMRRSIVRIVSESIANDKVERAKQAIRYMLQIGLLASSLLAILFVAGAGHYISEKIFDSVLMPTLLYLPAIWLIIYTLQTLIAEAFRGFHDTRYATIFNGLISSIICACIFGFLWLKQNPVDIEIALIIIITAYAVNLLFALMFLKMFTGKKSTLKVKWISHFDLLKNSWILYFQNLLLFIMTSGHLWVLGYYSTNENVAIYGAVYRLMLIITTSLGMIRLTILPTIGHLYTKKRYNEIENVLKSAAIIAGIPAITSLLFLIILGKTILLVLYGGHYTAGYSALIVLSIANMINVVTGIPGTLMIMASKEKHMLIYTIISGFIGISLSILLVGPMTHLGVSIGAGTGIVLYNLLMAYYCKYKLSISTLISIDELSNLISKAKNIYVYFTNQRELR